MVSRISISPCPRDAGDHSRLLEVVVELILREDYRDKLLLSVENFVILTKEDSPNVQHALGYHLMSLMLTSTGLFIYRTILFLNLSLLPSTM